jgi:hypothetical protein
LLSLTRPLFDDDVVAAVVVVVVGGRRFITGHWFVSEVAARKHSASALRALVKSGKVLKVKASFKLSKAAVAALAQQRRKAKQVAVLLQVTRTQRAHSSTGVYVIQPWTT